MSIQSEVPHNKRKVLIDAEKSGKDGIKSERRSSRKSRHSSKEKPSFVIKSDLNTFTIDPTLYKQLSDFEKICQIGKGSSGVIYKYKNKNTGEIVAIKQEIANDENSFFVEQIKILSLLQHPTLNPLLGIIENKENDMKCLITPYYEKGDLNILQNSKEPKPDGWDFTQKYIIIYGIAVGMAILHKNNFLHRDLKPSSILISDQLEPIISSIDFPIHIDYNNGIYKPTAIYGTPLYTPLEAFKYDFDDGNSELNGKKADVYSYSMICYFLLTGLQPFGNVKNISTLFGALSKGTRPKFPEGFNFSLRKLIEQCWDEDPKERPSFERIVRTLGDPEFTQTIQDLDYKRIRKYSKLITPKIFFEDSIDDDSDLNKSTKHRLSLSRKSKHFSRYSLIKDKYLYIIKVNRKNITIKPTLYKNISDFKKIGQINSSVGKYKNKITDEIVVIKQHFLSEGDNTFRTRIKIVSNLYHPTLSPIMGIINNLEGKDINLVLPFYEKGDLLHMIENKENPPEGWDDTQKYIILYGVAVGLTILHKNNLYHQYFRTSSIFLSGQLEPIICNYDAPTYVQYSDSEPPGLSHTYLFMPPELLDDDDNNDDFDGELANVYSYAWICYQLLTGLSPFNQVKTNISLLSAIISGERSDFPTDIDQSLKKLIEQCWVQNPINRPQFLEIVRTLSKKEFIESIKGLNYSRIYQYIQKITPEEYIEENSEEHTKRHRSSSFSRKSSRHSTKHISREKINLSIKVDQNDFKINPALYKDLSDFDKTDEIGKGSWGTVYKCINKKSYETVAIKQGNADKQSSSYSFYLEEIKILSLFSNPTINSILGIIESKENNEKCIITPYYPNGDLFHFMISKGKSSTDWDYTQKYIVLYGIAVGMAILHKNNFLHRDLKPESILLSDQLEPTINNFNLSTHIDSKEGNYKPTESVGTLQYTPLEAMNIGPNNDTIEINGKKVDVYSFSLVCYYLFTEQKPFGSIENSTEMTEMLSKGKRPEIPQEINPELRKMMEKCWNEDPNERPTFDDIVFILSNQEMLKQDTNFEYKRIRKYQKKVTPIEMLEEVKMKKAATENENGVSNDDEEVVFNIDLNNFSYDKSLNRNLSNYIKLDKIGKGGYGCVFKYKDKESGEFYAVKKVISDLTDDVNLQREVMISSKLIHPTLQPLCGINIGEDSIALFTPFCANGDLLHMIEEGNVNKAPPEWNETQKYIVMYGVAAGMYVLHKNNFIHRDMKPGNILLSDNLEPLITDFGCSKMVDQGNLMYQTAIVGTMQFMAPEILMSDDIEYDGKKADVYAYAILCYQLLTGIRPFENVKRIDMYNLLRNEVRPDFPEDFNPVLIEFIEKCWKQNPDDRYTFEEILNILGNKSFIEKVGNIDVEKFRQYQKKVVTSKFRK